MAMPFAPIVVVSRRLFDAERSRLVRGRRRTSGAEGGGSSEPTMFQELHRDRGQELRRAHGALRGAPRCGSSGQPARRPLCDGPPVRTSTLALPWIAMWLVACHAG